MSKKMNVGLLRQWLNEDRIDDPDKMVTNEMLEKWQADESEEMIGTHGSMCECEICSKQMKGSHASCCECKFCKPVDESPLLKKAKRLTKRFLDYKDGINEIEDKINEIAQVLEDHLNKDL